MIIMPRLSAFLLTAALAAAASTTSWARPHPLPSSSSRLSTAAFLPPAPGGVPQQSLVNQGCRAPSTVRFTPPSSQVLLWPPSSSSSSSSSSSPLVRPKGLTARHISPALIQDIGGAAVVAAASTLWLKIWTTLASKGQIDSKISRKVIHCGSGPLFMLCWPFFSSNPSARFVAASVPLLQVLALLVSGLSKNQREGGKAQGLVAAISRSGKPQEVLRGPFIYVLVLLLATVLYWRNNVVGLIAVSQMAAGDGMADIVGRKFGTIKWPFSKDKSYAGSLAFVVAGFLVTLGLMSWWHFWGLITLTPSEALSKVAAISVLCAFVELSPPSTAAWKIPIGDDNVSVPLAASLLAILLFPSSATLLPAFP